MSEKKQKERPRKGDVWVNEDSGARARVVDVRGEAPRVFFHLVLVGTGPERLGAQRDAWEASFVRGRKLVERGGKAEP